MISVGEAQERVLAIAKRASSTQSQPITNSLACVLAEEIVSDVDLPPFRKAMMDGFAVRAENCQKSGTHLKIVEEITAGQIPVRMIESGQCARIMTGAPMPEGANAVVMVEHCTTSQDMVTVNASVRNGQNIQPIGAEIKKGAVAVAPGSIIRPPEIALLSTLGRTSIRVFPPPKVAVLATGDELVPPDQTPKPGQIRNSNAAMLVAQAMQAHATPRNLGIARDDRDHLGQLIAEGLSSDILILSGGVSAGKLDLVPDVLKELGVTPHFHKIAMKPGKPLFFGSRDATLVFGLPGNPVSSFVGFELFVRPAIHRYRGVDPAVPTAIKLPLAASFRHSSDRPTYHPARIKAGEFGENVMPTAWHGSPDLRGLAAANALAIFPAGEIDYPTGTAIPVLRLS